MLKSSSVSSVVLQLWRLSKLMIEALCAAAVHTSISALESLKQRTAGSQQPCYMARLCFRMRGRGKEVS